VGWVTPNLNEAGALLGESGPDRNTVPDAAERIASLAPGLNVVVTGGHLDLPDDFLWTAGGQARWFPGRQVEARGRHGIHGTGCAFSTALLCRLLQGDDPTEAVTAAKAFVVQELSAGA
jgi:hydroxymethylpyrimidine/phosphomethylpyrimidine kinase